MEILTVLAFFILGMVSGACLTIATTVVLGKRILDRNKQEPATKKPESVNSRMKKVKEITQEQLSLQSGAQGPQKNALHGRYKNGLIGRIKELETEKNDILKSILADGFDPEITVMDEAGVVTNIKLSEFMAQNGITMPPKQEPVKPAPSAKQVGKFTVYRGGKDDGGNTTH